MRTIHKFVLATREYQIIEIPRLDCPQVLSIEEQYDRVVMYALVDASKLCGVKKVEVLVFGTGQNFDELDNDFRFLGTVKLSGGGLMFHVFVKEN